MEKESTENKAAGEAYQKEFAAKEGVKKIDNGIQYVVVKAGEGEALDPAEKVMVHYTGKFTDGTVFDTSLEPKRGRPVAAVPMAVSGARLIPAFGQVLPLMKIGPNETLVFEIEVLEKVKAPAAKVVNPAAAEKAGSAAK
jgi:FKBP-type peptidyl-prolyl cis-trans isomerase